MCSLDLKSDNNATPEIIVTVGDTTTYNYGKIFQLNDAWQTIQLPWFGMSTNAANLHLGYYAPPLGLTQPGGAGIQVQLRNFAVYEITSQPKVAISQQLSVASDVRIAGSLIDTSDSRLKTDVQALDSAKATRIIQSVEPKTYSRTDMEAGRRLGCLADDIMTACLENELYVSNLVSRTGDGQYLGVDYSRLVSILWSVCRQQEERLQALEAKSWIRPVTGREALARPILFSHQTKTKHVFLFSAGGRLPTRPAGKKPDRSWIRPPPNKKVRLFPAGVADPPPKI